MKFQSLARIDLDEHRRIVIESTAVGDPSEVDVPELVEALTRSVTQEALETHKRVQPGIDKPEEDKLRGMQEH